MISAPALFGPVARDYERWSALLSLGQDPRWRATLVAGLELPPGARVLDVAAGTGTITRLLRARDCRPIALDITAPMLRRAAAHGLVSVRATADSLPFGSATRHQPPSNDHRQSCTHLLSLRFHFHSVTAQPVPRFTTPGRG